MTRRRESLNVFVANLAKRGDRRQHTVTQFKNKREFNVSIINPVEEGRPAKSLWETIKHIIKNRISDLDDFFIFCEDDHLFTDVYSRRKLFKYIDIAKNKKADVLLGGVSWFQTPIRVSEDVFWIEKFSGLQFTIIFKAFYDTIINAVFGESDVADYKISDLSERKFVIYPFISIQRDFGYSDVTYANNKKGFVESLFDKSAYAFELLNEVYAVHSGRKKNDLVANIQKDVIIIPAFVITDIEQKERVKSIKSEFLGRQEFDLKIVQSCKPLDDVIQLWSCVKQIINYAITNEEDVIIICKDDHIFTNHYDKSKLIENIIEAHRQGCDILCGGVCGGFNHALFLTPNRIWINSFMGVSLMIIFRKLFSKILAETVSESSNVDTLLSEITSNKMLLYPFISAQKDFDFFPKKYHKKGIADTPFFMTNKRIRNIKNAAMRYGLIKSK